MATLLGVIAIGVFILLMVAVSRNKSSDRARNGGDNSGTSA